MEREPSRAVSVKLRLRFRKDTLPKRLTSILAGVEVCMEKYFATHHSYPCRPALLPVTPLLARRP